MSGFVSVGHIAVHWLGGPLAGLMYSPLFEGPYGQLQSRPGKAAKSQKVIGAVAETPDRSGCSDH